MRLWYLGCGERDRAGVGVLHFAFSILAGCRTGHSAGPFLQWAWRRITHLFGAFWARRWHLLLAGFVALRQRGVNVVLCIIIPNAG